MLSDTPIEHFIHLVSLIISDYFGIAFAILLLSEHVRAFGKVIFLAMHKKTRKHSNTKNLIPIFPRREKKISILIPAHNEEAGIERSIKTAINTNYSNKEIIVIDDCSSDNTFAIAKKYADIGLIKLLRREKDGSKAKALNFASQHATGDIIITLDADASFLGPDSLTEINKKFDEDDRVSALSGNLRVEKGDGNIQNIWTRLQVFEFIIGTEIGKRFTAILNTLLVIPGGFSVFKADVLKQIGKFDHSMIGEDFDLSLRIHRHGDGGVGFAEKSVANLYCPNNWRDLARQRNRWAYGQLQTLLKHKDVLFSSHPVRLKLAVLDMWLMDIFMNLVWLATLGCFAVSMLSGYLDSGELSSSRMQFIAFAFLLYFASEVTLFSYAIRISSRGKRFKLIYLIPLMIFFYRPMMRVLAVKGHMNAIFGKKIRW